MTYISLINYISFPSKNISAYCLVAQLILMWGSVITCRPFSTGSSINFSLLYPGTNWSIGHKSTQMTIDLFPFLLLSSITNKTYHNTWNSIYNSSFWSIHNFQNRLNNYRSKWFSTYYTWLMWDLLPFLILSSDLLIIFANKTTNSIYL